MAGKGGDPPQRAISKDTPITISLVALVIGAAVAVAYKAGAVVAELERLKAGISELRADVGEMKRVLYRIDRQPREVTTQKTSQQN